MSRISLFLCLCLLTFCACNKTPDHARYIPKDAVAVAGVNLKGLSKKIAWNMITGSKLFKEMQKRIPEKNAQDAMGGIEKAGIDYLNTVYVYVKADARFAGGNRITGLVPLSDAGQWETYVKQVFPNVQIKQHGDRKEASLGTDMYVGWNKNLMIIINVMQAGQPNAGAEEDGAPATTAPSAQPDISAEMDKAFGVTKDNSIIKNKHFQGLQDEGHDILFWLNYDMLMTQMNGSMADRMGGVSLSNSLWKDAAFTAGFDFKQGKITGDMYYFVPDSLKQIGMDFASNNADKDMLHRISSQNLDMLMAMHIAPKAIKEMLVKTELLGIANLGISQSGMNMTLDNILDAFTGDMAIAVNDFSLRSIAVTDTFMGQTITHQVQKPNFDVSFVMKINNKDNFNKLMDVAKANGLQQAPNGFIMPIDDKDSVYIMMNDQYLVAANKRETANGFLQGSFKSQTVPADISSQVYDHPWSLYFDINQLFKNVDPGITNSPRDSALLTESKKLLKNVSLNGGSFKNNAFEYHLDVNFNNTDESSIIQLMDYGMRMSDASKLQQ
jgi:hypothetical protein